LALFHPTSPLIIAVVDTDVKLSTHPLAYSPPSSTPPYSAYRHYLPTSSWVVVVLPVALKTHRAASSRQTVRLTQAGLLALPKKSAKLKYGHGTAPKLQRPSAHILPASALSAPEVSVSSIPVIFVGHAEAQLSCHSCRPRIPLP
jgi:hypothetical protein